jgi:hypothetical protein
MQIDFSKVSYKDRDDMFPVQVHYNYDALQEELDGFVKEAEMEGNIPEGAIITGMEFMLTIYGTEDYQLDAVFIGDEEEYIVTIEERLADAEAFTAITPDYATIAPHCLAYRE